MTMNELTTTTPHAVAQVETAATAIAAQAKALVEARYMVALHRPRDWDKVRDSLLKDCRRPGFADSAIYHKPVGRDGIRGPSIRFAEAAIRSMTNVVVETMTVFDDHERRIVRVSVTDLEANVPYSQDVTISKTVERNSTKQGDNVLRSRTGSRGQIVYILEATDDDILNKANALVSKAVRTLGLRLLPGDILDECMAVCETVQKDRDAQDPDAARRRLFDLFSGQGVSPDQLKEWLGHDGAKISLKEHETLRGIYTALREGETNWREVMDAKIPKVDPKDPPPATTKPGASRASQLAADLGAKANTTTEGQQP
jgi:hypothetical protein